jgi:hypothetical protein
MVDPRTMDAAAWLGVVLMGWGPWAFQIIGLYVWLVAASIRCLAVLHLAGWRPLLLGSWSLYLWYRLAPHALSGAQFESTFPMLAWQLLFVHGVAIGFYRERVCACVARWPRVVPILFGGTSAAFIVFALCNPWTEGPSWLQWSVVSPERFTDSVHSILGLTDLGIGRLLNLAVSLPVGYVLLTRCWAIVRPLSTVFVTLGQQSLGAFVLHVYGILLIANTPLLPSHDVWANTLIQISQIVAIAALLNGVQRLHLRLPTMPAPQPAAAA